MNKILSFNVKNFKLEEEKDNTQFLSVTFYAMSDGINRNNSAFTEESLRKAIPSLVNKPILAYFDKNEITDDGIGDFTEHIMNVKYDFMTDDTYFDTLQGERPIGIIPESSTIEIVEYKDRKFLTFTGLIWAKYNKYAVDLLKKRRSNKVSVEIVVDESEVDENNIEWIHGFSLTGVTLLGKNYKEGIQDAHLKLSEYVETDNYKQFKKVINFALNKECENNLFYGLSMNQLKMLVESQLSKYKYSNVEYEWNKYWIDDITDNYIIVHDNEDGKIYRLNYTYTDTLNIDFDSKQTVVIDYKPITFAQRIALFLDKEKWGTGEKLIVDKSSKSVSDDSWGSIDKTALMNKVLLASNYKTIVDDVYLVVGKEWEKSPTGDEGLKYPVMQIKNGKLIYNKNGISKALAYAEAQDEKTVVSKAIALQKKLKLNSDQKHMKYIKERDGENMGVKEFIDNGGKYKYIAETENYVLCYKLETSEIYMASYTKQEDNMVMNEEDMKMVSLLANYTEGNEEKSFDCGKAMTDMFVSEEENKKTYANDIKSLSEEKEKMMCDIKSLSEDKEKLMSEKVNLETEIKSFKEKQMSEELDKFAEEKQMSEEEKKEFTDKIKEFSDVKEFKKDLVFTYHEKYENKPTSKHFTMGNLINSNKSKKITPFDKIKNI